MQSTTCLHFQSDWNFEHESAIFLDSLGRWFGSTVYSSISAMVVIDLCSLFPGNYFPCLVTGLANL